MNILSAADAEGWATFVLLVQIGLFICALVWLVLPFFLLHRLAEIQKEIKNTTAVVSGLMQAGHGGLNVINANVAAVRDAVRQLAPSMEYPPAEEDMEYPPQP